MKYVLIIIFSLSFIGLSNAQTGPGSCPNGCFDEGPYGPECGDEGYFDKDGDGYGTGSLTCYFSSSNGSYAPRGGDCNDNNPNVFPRRFFVDSDGDGFGGNNLSIICKSAGAPVGYSTNSSDCDDNNSNINISKTWYQDYDNDGFGDTASAVTGCLPPGNLANPTNVGGDFDDGSNLITNVQPRFFYYDGDNDGFGNTSQSVYQSFAPTQYVSNNTDCNDNNSEIKPNTVWYLDTDGDGLGSSTSFNKVQCVKPANDVNGSYLLSNTDLCPNEFGSIANNGCTNLDPLAVYDDERNWLWSINYDLNGSIIANNINYYDNLGKSNQKQSIDIKTGKIWVNNTLYDYEGMPSFRTLSAPIGSPAQFSFNENFIRKADGNTYTTADFENNPATPTKVGSQQNSLGWYFSDNNSSEPYQDATDYPFSRTIFSKLRPGVPLKNYGGNMINDEWPQSYIFSMVATEELSKPSAFGSTDYNSYKITKTISRDINGDENVLFVDTDGKTLAAARSGGTSRNSMQVQINKIGFVDIHVPSGSNMGFTVSENGNSVTTYDLITETITSPSNSLPNGFYRVSVIEPESYDINNPVTVTYQENYYDYSLNDYDEAGRLTASYQQLNKLKTEYKYNSLGQLVYTKSPDEGEAWFKYRADGQIRYSQNSKQVAVNEVSFTDYDDFGRPVESGVLTSSNFSSLNPDSLLPSGARKEGFYTIYDIPLNTLTCQSEVCNVIGLKGGQAFVNGNVAISGNEQCDIYYSYDIYGRVKWLVQNISGLGVKTVDYSYDAVTGLVNIVDYQKGNVSERFIHRYTYNQADQLIKVETSTNASSYTTHAEYEYFETGALKRIEYAEGIQGVDYVYNLSGQLKGINHPDLNSSNDPGLDNNDLFGMQLDYHQADYKRTRANITSATYGEDQLNGNIKGIRWNNTRSSSDPSIYAYTYDRNNWLLGADYGTYIGSGNSNAPSVYEDTNVYIDGSDPVIREAKESITLKPNFHAREGSNYTARS